MIECVPVGVLAAEAIAGTVDVVPVAPLDLEALAGPDSMREKIDRLESQMKAMPQLEIAVTHHFCDGLYAREILIPAGTILTGKIHKGEHLNIVSKGSITVWTEDGMKRVSAPFTMVSRPGTKRVGYTHEETVWTTIHATTETDLERLEDLLIAKDFDALEVPPEIAALQEKKS